MLVHLVEIVDCETLSRVASLASELNRKWKLANMTKPPVNFHETSHYLLSIIYKRKGEANGSGKVPERKQ